MMFTKLRDTNEASTMMESQDRSRVTLSRAARRRVPFTHRSSDIVAHVTGVRYEPLRLDTRLLPEDFS
jgi:hypothetical protein